MGSTASSFGTPPAQAMKVSQPAASPSSKDLSGASPLVPASWGAAHTPSPAKKGGPLPKKNAKRSLPENHKVCKCCTEVLCNSCFDTNRAVCKECDLATEALQRLMRKNWGKSYKSKLKAAKDDKAKWYRAVICIRVAAKSGKRILAHGATAQHSLQNVKTKPRSTGGHA